MKYSVSNVLVNCKLLMCQKCFGELQIVNVSEMFWLTANCFGELQTVNMSEMFW